MRTVDLFAGCGGLSKGFESAGFEVAAAYENWSQAIAVYRLNFDHPVFSLDLSNVDHAAAHISQWCPDAIIGGPPCQDFSHAGKRKEGQRANLTVAYAEIVASLRPQLVLMENVDRSLNSDAYIQARKVLTAAGYGLTEIILDASLCGVPQKRKRFFSIGLLGEPAGVMKQSMVDALATKPMTLRDYMGEELEIEFYYRHPRNYSRRAVFSVDEPAPTVRGVNRPVPAGYTGHPGDPVVLDGIRSLTTHERARIQTFPADFKWVGCKTDLEQMIGNAVPVELAAFVGRRIMEHLGEKRPVWREKVV